MHDIFAKGESIQLVFHNDDVTPMGFVEELLRSVFGKPRREAGVLSASINEKGKCACGPYPPLVARALLETAQQRVQVASFPLLITAESTGASGDTDEEEEEFEYAWEALDWHFEDASPTKLVTAVRQFPSHTRADIQGALYKLLEPPIRFFGLREQYRYDSTTIARLIRAGPGAHGFAPPQYVDLDVGESTPVECLTNGLWLCEASGVRYAVLMGLQESGAGFVIRVEIAVAPGAAGAAVVQRCFGELERAVREARCYRGKILSLESIADYRGRSSGLTVHRLPAVAREEVILPERTLQLLDRNIFEFVGSRDALRSFGQSTRKGILLYGPPGTGKTHTIRYLATSLPGHTTLLITAEQVGYLAAYMNLARLLQPTIVVIEDVDLIARDRDDMGPCEESMLNKLLNEMDGLKEDSDILFVLTTNRPEELESALAGRPGRIDQAIEVPLPDETGRSKLVQLYGKRLPISPPVLGETVRRTDGVSAAFIKELVRRITQSAIARDGGNLVTIVDIDQALDDMLFTGGRLNAKLLGGAQEMARA